MDAVLRAAILYLLLLLLFRILGKRALSQATTFDFVLLLIVGEATQQALLGDDFSLTMALTVIGTLVGLDRIADYLGYRFPKMDKLLESMDQVKYAVLEKDGGITIVPRS